MLPTIRAAKAFKIIITSSSVCRKSLLTAKGRRTSLTLGQGPKSRKNTSEIPFDLDLFDEFVKAKKGW